MPLTTLKKKETRDLEITYPAHTAHALPLIGEYSNKVCGTYMHAKLIFNWVHLCSQTRIQICQMSSGAQQQQKRDTVQVTVFFETTWI